MEANSSLHLHNPMPPASRSRGKWPFFSAPRGYNKLVAVWKGRTSPADRPLSQFSETALLPGGPQSLSTSYIHLESMTASLTDIVAFWDDHVVHLAAISDKRTPLVRPEPELQKSMAAWARYQTVLLAAISSISESSDAAAVDPPKAGVSAPNASAVGAILTAPVPVPAAILEPPRTRRFSESAAGTANGQANQRTDSKGRGIGGRILAFLHKLGQTLH
jgi:hypothetical protein